jgi:alkylation response protein AidB-like acyl-CoA dehydrogenase
VVSGCEIAGRFALASVFMDGDTPHVVEGRPDVRFVMVRPDVVEILDTWSDVEGLRGSGSHAVRVDDALVGADQAFDPTRPPAFERPAFRVGLGVGAHSVASGVLLGAARAALDGLVALAKERVSAASGQAWRDWPNVQLTVATTAAELASARAGLVEAAEAAWASVIDGPEVPAGCRAVVYGMCDLAHRTARSAVSRLFSVGSIDGLHRGSILQQALRDVHALSVNWERYGQLAYDAGRVMLDLPPVHPIF